VRDANLIHGAMQGRRIVSHHKSAEVGSQKFLLTQHQLFGLRCMHALSNQFKQFKST